MTPAIIFDLDDTLYPERQFIRSGFRAVAGEVEPPLRRSAAEARWPLLRAPCARAGADGSLQSLCRALRSAARRSCRTWSR